MRLAGKASRCQRWDGRPVVNITPVQVVGAQFRLSQLLGCATVKIQQQTDSAQVGILSLVTQAVDYQGFASLTIEFWDIDLAPLTPRSAAYMSTHETSARLAREAELRHADAEPSREAVEAAA
jgi:hypothetical protein